MKNCPKCGFENPDDAKNCNSCEVNLKYAFDNKEYYQQKGKEEVLERLRFEEEERLGFEKIRNIVLSTTNNIQGKNIVEYLGLATSVVVLGTGFFSTFDADISDFLGIRAEKYQNKINKANAMVLFEMKNQAAEKKGDAIIGIDLDYSVSSNDKFMVVGTGTIVKFG